MSLETIKQRIAAVKNEIADIRLASGNLFLEKQKLELQVNDYTVEISKNDNKVEALQSELSDLQTTVSTIEKYDKQGG